MEYVLQLPYSLLLEATDTSTPWGLAKQVIEDGNIFAESDGWNYDGSLTNTYNKQPYADIPFYQDDDGNVYEGYDKVKRTSFGKIKIDKQGYCKTTPNPWYW